MRSSGLASPSYAPPTTPGKPERGERPQLVVGERLRGEQDEARARTDGCGGRLGQRHLVAARLARRRARWPPRPTGRREPGRWLQPGGSTADRSGGPPPPPGGAGQLGVGGGTRWEVAQGGRDGSPVVAAIALACHPGTLDRGPPRVAQDLGERPASAISAGVRSGAPSGAPIVRPSDDRSQGCSSTGVIRPSWPPPVGSGRGSDHRCRGTRRLGRGPRPRRPRPGDRAPPADPAGRLGDRRPGPRRARSRGSTSWTPSASGW